MDYAPNWYLLLYSSRVLRLHVFFVINKIFDYLYKKNLYITVHLHVISFLGLHDTVFDVDHDNERAQAQGFEANGFNFDGADAAGVDYALNR